jgi:hypothetical protein
MTYEAIVDEWVRRCLPEASTLAELIPRLPGVYPTEVVASLQRQGIQLASGASELLVRLNGPVPHPLDGDWRLHPDSHRQLLDISRKQSASRVALLGCPSLSASFSTIASVALVDINSAWAPYIGSLPVEAIWGDVSSVLPRWVGRFDLVVADPPWYPLEFERFLAVAASLVVPGGAVALSWPSEGTRPGIAQEREKLIENAAQMHLELKRWDRNVLRYATPFHEGCALRAAGLPVLAAWRGADLIVFAKRSGLVVQPIPLTSSNPWKEATCGTLNLRIKTDLSASRDGSDPRLVRVLEGDVLPTVSRRDGRRAAAKIWTAGNRIFGCARPDLFEAIALGIAEDVPGPHSLSRMLGRELSGREEEWAVEAEAQILSVERIESAEYDALHEPRNVPVC